MSVHHSPQQSSPQQSSPPMRRCLICREAAPKPELLRVVRKPDGEVMVSTRDHGRGAYIHPHPECLSTASSQPKHLARALRRPPPGVILDQLDQLVEVPSV